MAPNLDWRWFYVTGNGSCTPIVPPEPTRSERRVDAGFTPRDKRLECDTCGKLFTPQFLPIHKCEAEPKESE